ncbi:TolC family outer membrane protein [Vibrio agarivorans]|uniref:TolC family outer membrane protein n=1 Tax=Vibrio agarivorans TaxID=153622 RepID=UPI003F512DEF
MKPVKTLCCTLMLGSTLASGVASALTLEESVAFAIDYSPEVLGQYARYQSVIRQQDSIRGNYLPQVNLYGAIGQEQIWTSSDVDIDDNGTRSEIGLKVSQLIFDGFATTSDIDRLGYEAESERLTLISRSENVALDVARIYLELLKAQTVLELTDRNVREHEEIYADIEDKVAKGLSSQSDLAQVAARVATSKTSYISALNNLSDLQAQYRTLVGRNVSGLTSPKFDQGLIPTSLAVAQKQAVENHPEIRAAIVDMDAARKEMKREKGGYYPEVRLEGYANRNDNVGGELNGLDEDARIMLVVDYDLFNGFSTNANVEASAWRAEEARAIRLRADREVREGTELAWNAYSMLDQQLDLLKQNVDAAKIAEVGYLQQFNVGRRSLLDVLDSKVEVFLARQNYVNTLYDHSFAAYRLLNAMGILTYALRVEHPQEWQEEAK